jgi:hypothetical protein
MSALLKETADSFGELIADHIRLARIELAVDLKTYLGALGLSLVAALLFVIAYAFAWVSLALVLARLCGAPIAFGAAAAFHLVGGGVLLRVVSGRVKRTKVMRESLVEVRRTAHALAHPAEGGAS